MPSKKEKGVLLNNLGKSDVELRKIKQWKK